MVRYGDDTVPPSAAATATISLLLDLDNVLRPLGNQATNYILGSHNWHHQRNPALDRNSVVYI